MSYDPQDAAFDQMYERISDELYPEHKERALSDFTEERLRSFYLDNPAVMRPAVDILQEVKRLQENGHSSATVVFCATAIELFLKATLLQPIVYGLVLAGTITVSPGLAAAIWARSEPEPGVLESVVVVTVSVAACATPVASASPAIRTTTTAAARDLIRRS